MTIDIDQLLADLQSALVESSPEQSVREILSRLISRPSELLATLGEPGQAEIQRLHVSPELTVLNVIWGSHMTLKPHNHNMWAVIGVYMGREDNIFWRRLETESPGLEAAGAKTLGPGEVHPLGRDIIHSVTNPTGGLTGAIHVYGGDFFETPRSEWEPLTLRERPYDVNANMRLFEEANAGQATPSG